MNTKATEWKVVREQDIQVTCKFHQRFLNYYKGKTVSQWWDPEVTALNGQI